MSCSSLRAWQGWMPTLHAVPQLWVRWLPSGLPSRSLSLVSESLSPPHLMPCLPYCSPKGNRCPQTVIAAVNDCLRDPDPLVQQAGNRPPVHFLASVL